MNLNHHSVRLSESSEVSAVARPSNSHNGFTERRLLRYAKRKEETKPLWLRKIFVVRFLYAQLWHKANRFVFNQLLRVSIFLTACRYIDYFPRVTGADVCLCGFVYRNCLYITKLGGEDKPWEYLASRLAFSNKYLIICFILQNNLIIISLFSP